MFNILASNDNTNIHILQKEKYKKYLKGLNPFFNGILYKKNIYGIINSGEL